MFSSPSHGKKTIAGQEFNVYPPATSLFPAAVDEGAGIDKMFYKINKRPFARIRQQSLDFYDKGRYKVRIKAVDRVGNTSFHEVEFLVGSDMGKELLGH